MEKQGASNNNDNGDGDDGKKPSLELRQTEHTQRTDTSTIPHEPASSSLSMGYCNSSHTCSEADTDYQVGHLSHAVARDPSGILIHEPSQKMPYKPSSRFIASASGRLSQLPSPDLMYQNRFRLTLPAEATIPAARPHSLLESMHGDSAISGLSGSSSRFFVFASSLFKSPGGVHYDPHKEYLASVQFHWTVRDDTVDPTCWPQLQPDHPTLPPVLWPYLKRHHWAQFLEALVELAGRNHWVGTLYVVLGILASMAGLAYGLYGVIPLASPKFCSLYISVGVGAALWLAGICLWIWGRANRAGGVLFHQDLELLCENMSSQIPGLTIQYYSAQALQRESSDWNRKLVFGVELFATEEEEDLETTHPAYADMTSQRTMTTSANGDCAAAEECLAKEDAQI